jgi:hypothetical protein
VGLSNRVKGALTTTVLATAATGFLSACGSDGDSGDSGDFRGDDGEQRAYCTDQDGKIVDDDLCDDDRGGGGGLFFFYLGGFRPGLPLGTVLPAGGTRIDPRNASARTAAGLPGTGRVSGGTRVSGGIGSGTGGKVGGTGGSSGRVGSAGG